MGGSRHKVRRGGERGEDGERGKEGESKGDGERRKGEVGRKLVYFFLMYWDFSC